MIIKVIHKPDFQGTWHATIVNGNDAIFCGSGNSINEAIGHCIVSNREALGISMFGTNEEGEPWASRNAPEKTRKLVFGDDYNSPDNVKRRQQEFDDFWLGKSDEAKARQRLH